MNMVKLLSTFTSAVSISCSDGGGGSRSAGCGGDGRDAIHSDGLDRGATHNDGLGHGAIHNGVLDYAPSSRERRGALQAQARCH